MGVSIGARSRLPVVGGFKAWFMSTRNPAWRLKLRLQFTGWLQYMGNGVLATVFGVLAAIGWLIGVWAPLLFWLPAAISAALYASLVLDLVTVKLRLHPTEAIPRARDELDAFDLMRSRRSCRSFQTTNLTDAHRAAILTAVREQTQPDRLIGSRQIRFEYVAAPLTVWATVGAHEFLVAIAPKEYEELAIIDVGRSLQKVVLQATRMGVATCWIGPGADHKSITADLGDRFDPARDHIICVCAIGYRSRYWPLLVRWMGVGMHHRLPLSQLFFADPTFTEPLPIEQPPFSQFGRCYEVCQWSPSSYNGQTTRAAAVTEGTGDQKRLVRMDFAAATESRYYAPVALGIWCADWETGCQALGISGHFAVLTPQERGLPHAPELPRYDVSWIPDQPMTA
jgi:nitroreductase